MDGASPAKRRRVDESSSLNAHNGCLNPENAPLVEELFKLKLRVRENSHLGSNYYRAITSVRMCKDTITSGVQAKALHGIGNFIAGQIQAVLQRLANGTAEQEEKAEASAPAPAPAPTIASPSKKASQGSRESRERIYRPSKKKQPWYVLIKLYEEEAFTASSAITTDSLFEKLQSSGFPASSRQLRSCLGSLTSTYKVTERSDDGNIFLTAIGKRSAFNCVSEYRELDSSALPIDNRNNISIESIDTESGDEWKRREDVVEVEEDEFFDNDEFLPLEERLEREQTRVESTKYHVNEPGDTWEVVLLLDHRESTSRNRRSEFERKLVEKGVECEVRNLHIGDMQWIGRRTRGGSTDEFMLNVIVERKEVKDLSGSIVDRRYAEQKMRLKDTGATHVIYLVEGSITQETAVTTQRLQSAICRTQVEDHFYVHLSPSADESFQFLADVHSQLLSEFPFPSQLRTSYPHVTPTIMPTRIKQVREVFILPVISFDMFNTNYRKQNAFTVGQVYQRMLMQIRGVSGMKACAISRTFKTMKDVRNAIREGKVEHVRCGEKERKVGKKTTENIAHVLLDQSYE